MITSVVRQDTNTAVTEQDWQRGGKDRIYPCRHRTEDEGSIYYLIIYLFRVINYLCKNSDEIIKL